MDSSRVERLLELSSQGSFATGSELLELGMSLAVDSLDTVELGRLNWSPRKNWVERAGGLPKYIEDIAIGVMKSGKTRERAIPIAISRVKRWAAGLDGVTAKTQAKALASLKEWELLKARNKARMKKK